MHMHYSLPLVLLLLAFLFSFLNSVSTLRAIVNGVGNPLITLLMGSVITSIGSSFNGTEKSVAEVKCVVIQFTYVGAIIYVASYIQMCAFSMSAKNQTNWVREKYLHAILRQDIAWHDTSKSNKSLNSRLSANTQLIFESLADKVGVCLSAFSLGSIGPSVTNFSKAQAAAYHIFRTIDRVPEIDSSSSDGPMPEKITGHIAVKDVDFAYPFRPGVPILNKMDIEVQPGQTAALVGHWIWKVNHHWPH